MPSMVHSLSHLILIPPLCSHSSFSSYFSSAFFFFPQDEIAEAQKYFLTEILSAM